MRDAIRVARDAAVATLTPGGLWLVLVVALFCLPLFIGLGRTDLQSDEAIYSFGADVMVADGDWLTPKSSPSADVAFLEKPPLKFWIVAAPIALGLLPHNEFGIELEFVAQESGEFRAARLGAVHDGDALGSRESEFHGDGARRAARAEEHDGFPFRINRRLQRF